MSDFGLCLVLAALIGGFRFSQAGGDKMQACGYYTFDTMISLFVCQLGAIVTEGRSILDAQAAKEAKRGTRKRGKGTRGGEAKAIKVAMFREATATHSGDGKNIANSGPSGIRGHVWYAWVGVLAMSLKGLGGRMEPVNCALVDLPSGKFGTQTPGTKDWQKVRAEFQDDPLNHGKRRAATFAAVRA